MAGNIIDDTTVVRQTTMLFLLSFAFSAFGDRFIWLSAKYTLKKVLYYETIDHESLNCTAYIQRPHYSAFYLHDNANTYFIQMRHFPKVAPIVYWAEAGPMAGWTYSRPSSILRSLFLRHLPMVFDSVEPPSLVRIVSHRSTTGNTRHQLVCVLSVFGSSSLHGFDLQFNSAGNLSNVTHTLIAESFV